MSAFSKKNVYTSIQEFTQTMIDGRPALYLFAPPPAADNWFAHDMNSHELRYQLPAEENAYSVTGYEIEGELKNDDRVIIIDI